MQEENGGFQEENRESQGRTMTARGNRDKKVPLLQRTFEEKNPLKHKARALHGQEHLRKTPGGCRG